MKKIFVLWILTLTVSSSFGYVYDTLALKAKPVYGKEARVIASILNDRHYRKIAFNDSLSSTILESYLTELDNNKTYLLASDIRSFEKYRFSIDDFTNSENVDPAYDIYNVFRKRYQERMDYVMNTLVNQDFDYTVDEDYQTDRDHEPWARDEAAL